jgi:hypothetical protein
MTEYVITDDLDRKHGSFSDQDDAYEERNKLREFYPNRELSVHPASEDEAEKESAEDNEVDDSPTMSANYDFMADDSSNDDEQQFDTVGSMWTLGSHTGISDQNTSSLRSALQTTLDEADEDVDGDVIDVLEDAAGLVENTSVSSFECPHPDCGLHHSHSDHKHDVRDSFAVTESFASQVEFTPFCHCGVNELAMLMEFYGYINTQVFEDGDRFEAADEIDPDDLNAAYRDYKEDSNDPMATANVQSSLITVADINLEKERLQEVRSFFICRSSIERAADGAPIPQKTQAVITENRDALIEATS